MAFGPTRKTLKPDFALAAVVAAAMAFTDGQAQAQAFPPEKAPCPTSTLTQPQGGSLAPFPAQCATPNCLVNFKGYRWWTSYEVPFFNGGLHTPFAPNHTSIGTDGNLHLMANNDINLGAGKVWSGAEAVLMFNGDGSEANLGYGNYLVTAQLVSGSNWSTLDPNMALGLFLYENPSTGPGINPARELDLAEISRWGWNHTGTCPIGGLNGFFPNSNLCKGDAQFALQLIPRADEAQGPLMVDRYDIGANSVVTLVMRWREGHQVRFEKYNGAHSLNNLPMGGMPPANPWAADPDKVPTPPIFETTPSSIVKVFVPEHTSTSCERFHINFWFGNYSAGMNPNPPPSSKQEVIITNFEFQP